MPQSNCQNTRTPASRQGEHARQFQDKIQMGNITKSCTMRLIKFQNPRRATMLLIKFQNLRRATMLLIKFQNLRRATMLLINVQNSWELPCPYKNSRVLEATTPLHHQLHHVEELHHNIKPNKTYPATMIIGGTTNTQSK